MQFKKDFLCVIHDKMDHLKTALPQFQVKNKMVSELGQLLVTLNGMIAHGHGDETSFNILMSSGPMILISQLGCFYACFIALKRSQLKSHGFCLYLNPKMHSSNKFYKEVFIV
jgi:hypothetical protein